MQVLSSHQCLNVSGAGRSVSGVISDATIGAATATVTAYGTLKAFEYTFLKSLWPWSTCFKEQEINQLSVLAGGIYFTTYIGASIYAHFQSDK